MRVHMADGPPQSVGDQLQRYLIDEEVWQIGERPTSGEAKCSVTDLAQETKLLRFMWIATCRWIC